MIGNMKSFIEKHLELLTRENRKLTDELLEELSVIYPNYYFDITNYQNICLRVKERQPNKRIGQYIAFKRMDSDISTGRGPSFIFLNQEDKENLSLKGLTDTIKELVVSEAERKNIRWMKGIKTNRIV